MPRITLAGEDLIAQKQAAQQPLNITRFIFANVPGLNPSDEVDRAAPKPPAGQIVYSAEIPPANKGYVNPSQVVYSLQVGSDIGDWDFNWIGLESAEGVLFAVAYMPLQQKRRNLPPLQIGNNITRNFLVVFDGAQALTGITIDASTWQHDFTVRLAGIDERERQSNRDIFGRACFFGSALQLEKVGGTYQLKPGTAYIEGVRIQRAAALPVAPPALPTTAWLDVALQRELNDVVATWSVVWGAGKVDYVDSAGVQHYCVAIADLPNSNTITDRRPVENIAGPLVAHFAARVGDYAGMRARSTTKDDVGLGNLPNAKSDDENTDSSLILATTKAVKLATAKRQPTHANLTALSGLVGGADQLPYFTGAGALSLATITAKARSLLASADEAAMRGVFGMAGANFPGVTFFEREVTLAVPGGSSVAVPDLPANACDILLFGVTVATGTSTNFVGRFTKANGAWVASNIFGNTGSSNSPSIAIVGGVPHFKNNHTSDYTFSYRLSIAAQAAGVANPFEFFAKLWHSGNLTPAELTPPGVVAHFARNSAPTGWLKANGAAVSRTSYSGLFAAIGTNFGAGDGSTTFNLPDLRGEFVRGWDDGRGVDNDRAFGTAQSHLLQEHNHGGANQLGNVAGGSGEYVFNGATGGATPIGANYTPTTGSVGAFGAETRPRNVALLACIKY